MRRLALALLGSALIAAACGEENAAVPEPIVIDESGPQASEAPPADPDELTTVAGGDTVDGEAGFEGRADIWPTGNRISRGAGDLTTAPVEVRLDSPAVWLVPSSPEPEAPWAAVLADGRLVWIDPVERAVEVLDPAWGDAEPIVRSGRIETWNVAADFPGALSDGRAVTDGEIVVVLAYPTDRYGHAVLGDDIEAGAIEIHAATDGPGLDARIELERDVVEGRTALLGDADGDGTDEILVTLSNADTGARLVLYDQAGALVAESDPIGRGNRWRNQLAIAPVGPNGEIEVVDIRTPHLGRTIEWFRLDGGRLELVAELPGFTSHVIGSRNLELAIVADPDGDGRLEVVASSPDRFVLSVVARTEDGAEVEASVDLGARLSSNIGAVDHDDGSASYAAGSDDGVVRFWLS
ncbi:MAG: hypothetical protein AAF548_18965 [Actinomycetota bacterium]